MVTIHQLFFTTHLVFLDGSFVPDTVMFAALGRRTYYPHFKDKETEVQRGQVTC